MPISWRRRKNKPLYSSRNCAIANKRDLERLKSLARRKRQHLILRLSRTHPNSTLRWSRLNLYSIPSRMRKTEWPWSWLNRIKSQPFTATKFRHLVDLLRLRSLLVTKLSKLKSNSKRLTIRRRFLNFWLRLILRTRLSAARSSNRNQWSSVRSTIARTTMKSLDFSNRWSNSTTTWHLSSPNSKTFKLKSSRKLLKLEKLSARPRWT